MGAICSILNKDQLYLIYYIYLLNSLGSIIDVINASQSSCNQNPRKAEEKDHFIRRLNSANRFKNCIFIIWK